MADYLWQILINLSLFSILVAIVTGVLLWGKLPVMSRWFVTGLIFYFVIFAASFFFSKGARSDTFAYASAFFDCLFFAVFYCFSFPPQSVGRKVVIYSGLVVAATLLIDFWLWNGSADTRYSFSLKNAYIVASSALVVIRMMMQLRIPVLNRNPVFLIAFTKLMLVIYSIAFEAIRATLIKEHLDAFLVLYATDLTLHIAGSFVYARAIFLSAYLMKQPYHLS